MDYKDYKERCSNSIRLRINRPSNHSIERPQLILPLLRPPMVLFFCNCTPLSARAENGMEWKTQHLIIQYNEWYNAFDYVGGG